MNLKQVDVLKYHVSNPIFINNIIYSIHRDSMIREVLSPLYLTAFNTTTKKIKYYRISEHVKVRQFNENTLLLSSYGNYTLLDIELNSLNEKYNIKYVFGEKSINEF